MLLPHPQHMTKGATAPQPTVPASTHPGTHEPAACIWMAWAIYIHTYRLVITAAEHMAVAPCYEGGTLDLPTHHVLVMANTPFTNAGPLGIWL